MENNLQLFSFLIDEDTIDDVNLYAFILPNEVREIIGFDKLNTKFSQQHFITKNYDTAENRLIGDK